MNLLQMLFTKKAPEDPEIMQLTESDDDAETALILGILRENDIPCYAKDKRAGSAARLYTGFSLAGSRICIRREDYEKASALLAVIRAEAGEDSTDPVTGDDSGENSNS